MAKAVKETIHANGLDIGTYTQILNPSNSKGLKMRLATTLLQWLRRNGMTV